MWSCEMRRAPTFTRLVMRVQSYTWQCRQFKPYLPFFFTRALSDVQERLHGSVFSRTIMLPKWRCLTLYSLRILALMSHREATSCCTLSLGYHSSSLKVLTTESRCGSRLMEASSSQPRENTSPQCQLSCKLKFQCSCSVWPARNKCRAHGPCCLLALSHFSSWDVGWKHVASLLSRPMPYACFACGLQILKDTRHKDPQLPSTLDTTDAAVTTAHQ